MFLTVFKETAKKMMRNKKNRLLVILFLLAAGIYSLFYLPQHEHPATIDRGQLELETESEYGMKVSRLSEGDIAVNAFTGIDTYSLSKRNYEQLFEYRDALQKGDFKRFMDIKAAYGLPAFTEGALSEHLDERAGGDIALKDYMRYTYYEHIGQTASMNEPTPHIFNEKTGLQQIYKFFLSYGPLIILFTVIFTASDVLVSDRHHRTLKAGQPIGWRRYVFYQSISMYIMIVVGIFSLLSVFFIFTGVLYGFGSTSMEVPRYSYIEGYRGEAFNFTGIPILQFIMQSLGLSLLLIYLFIRINAVLSLLFRHDVVVMIIGFLIAGFNRIYSGGSEDHFLGVPAHFLPQNYFEFGEVLGGRLNFTHLTDSFTFMQGVIIIIATILIIEVILSITQRIITRQKFEREAG